jgi:hypothetical protein
MTKYLQNMPFNKIHVLALFVFIVISVFSLRSFFATGDPVAFHDLAPMYRLDQLSRPFDFPWDYKSNLGTASVLTGNAVYNIPLIGLSLVFGSVAFAHKVLFVLLMGLSGFGFYLAFAYLFKSKTAGFAAGLYMMFNPFTLARWEYGHNTVLLAFMVLPFAVLFFFKVMREGGKWSLFACGLFTAVMIYASPQVAYLFILFALLYTFFDLAFSGKTEIAKKIVQRVVQGGLILVVALVAAFPFFYQLIMVNLPVYSTRAEEAAVAVSPLNVTGSIIPQVCLVAFVISVFFFLWWKSGFTGLYRWWDNGGLTEDSSPFLIKAGRQHIHFFALLGLLSLIIIFLVLPPFTPVYYWLFNNVPGLGMFREVSKFLMISALSVAFFLGLAAEGFKRLLAKKASLMRKALPVLLISLIVLASSWQFVTGDIDGSVGTVKIPQAYQDLDSWLASQNGDFRVAFFPPAVWATTYTWAPRWFLDPYVALQAQPTVEFKSESDLTQGASFTRWVYTTLYSNRTSDWGKLLSVLGVKYVIVRLDADMPSERGDLAAFSLENTIVAWGKQNSLKLVQNFTSVLVYENTRQLPIIYEANGLSVIVGDRGALVSLSDMNFDFSKYPVAFLDDNIELTHSLLNSSQYVFFQGDPYWSLVVSSLGEKYIVKPWNCAPISSNPWIQWVSGDLMWYFSNGDLSAAPDGYIYTEGEHTITVPLNVEATGKYRVLVQVYDGLSSSQGINFTVDNAESYVFKPTTSTEGSYRWGDIGSLTLNSQSELQISSLGGPAAVSKIAVVPENAINETAQNVSKLLEGSDAKVVYLFDDRAWSFNSTALIVNPEANGGRLIDLSNSSAETRFYVFNDGAYKLNLTFQNPEEHASVKVYVDGVARSVQLSHSAGGFSTEVEIGPLTLSEGYHNITIDAETGNAKFNMATLSSYADAADSPQNSVVSKVPSYTMRSGSEYVVTPTERYLAFLEAGNGYWKLEGQGGASEPICIFNYASLFPIDAPGSQYTLRYLGLGYIEQGFLVATVGTVLLALALKFLYPKRFIKRESEH